MTISQVFCIIENYKKNKNNARLINQLSKIVYQKLPFMLIFGAMFPVENLFTDKKQTIHCGE